jgi:benzil reductase ((S)-benzoin forming)
MKKFFITGTSSGIGMALAQKALADGHLVVGFSRRKKIEHHNYKHVKIDLADLDQYVNINFEISSGVTELVLINNAGTLGDVKPVRRLDPAKIDHAYRLNLTAPSILSSLFLNHTANLDLPRSVLNISSGAGSFAIPSWSTYCASKAALDMFTKVMKLDHPEVNCYAVGPGIVDTAMQGDIRSASEDDFPELSRFVDYKDNGELADPSEVARKLHHILNNPQDFKEVCFSLRDVSIK